MKWKLNGSLESQLCQMVFCWGKHVECLGEVDTGERLRRVKEGFADADTGERMFYSYTVQFKKEFWFLFLDPDSETRLSNSLCPLPSSSTAEGDPEALEHPC